MASTILIVLTRNSGISSPESKIFVEDPSHNQDCIAGCNDKRPQMKPIKRVMFVCKRSSCRSQIAEGFARSMGSASFEVVSAGLESSNVNPTAIEVMREVGIDISRQTSKPLSDFQAENFDAVISLCGCGANLPAAWTSRELFEDWFIDDQTVGQLKTFVRREMRLSSVSRNCWNPRKS